MGGLTYGSATELDPRYLELLKKLFPVSLVIRTPKGPTTCPQLINTAPPLHEIRSCKKGNTMNVVDSIVGFFNGAVCILVTSWLATAALCLRLSVPAQTVMVVFNIGTTSAIYYMFGTDLTNSLPMFPIVDAAILVLAAGTFLATKNWTTRTMLLLVNVFMTTQLVNLVILQEDAAYNTLGFVPCFISVLVLLFSQSSWTEDAKFWGAASILSITRVYPVAYHLIYHVNIAWLLCRPITIGVVPVLAFIHFTTFTAEEPHIPLKDYFMSLFKEKTVASEKEPIIVGQDAQYN